jgi:hypothetical protein
MMATRRMVDFQANATAIGGGMDLKGSGVYKMHRIHTTRLPSGVWVVSIVKLGVAKDDARIGGGPPVERIRGEYRSQGEAVSAAKQFVDRGDTPPEIALK